MEGGRSSGPRAASASTAPPLPPAQACELTVESTPTVPALGALGQQLRVLTLHASWGSGPSGLQAGSAMETGAGPLCPVEAQVPCQES